MSASTPGHPSGASRSDARSVLLAGGGSAGHVSPLLALADCLRRRDPSLQITALGTEEGLEHRLVPQRGYPLLTVPKVAFPRRPGPAVAAFPRAFTEAVEAAGKAMDDTGAGAVVGFGGYVSTPAYLAARRRRLPIIVHEANARPGLANRLGARLTRYVVTTFSATRLPHARLLGVPLRREITTLDRTAGRVEAAQTLGLDPALPTILVTGGSLGAQRLNTAFAGAVNDVVGAGVQVLHVTGLGKEFAAQPAPGTGRYVVVPYLDRMDLAYASADLVVARAGANTVCELTAVGLPAIYVPLPIGNGEQRLNAADVVRAGGGILVDDAAVTSDWVRVTALPLVTDRARLTTMSAAASSTGRRDGDERLADVLAEAWPSWTPEGDDR